MVARADDVVWRVQSNYGKILDARVYGKELYSAPEWKDANEDPPLPRKVAIEKAMTYAKTFNVDKYWVEVGDITLKRLHLAYYVYVVEIRFRPGKANFGGFYPTLNVVVLMNGKVVQFCDEHDP